VADTLGRVADLARTVAALDEGAVDEQAAADAVEG
jgi:hypothetical protein